MLKVQSNFRLTAHAAIVCVALFAATGHTQETAVAVDASRAKALSVNADYLAPRSWAAAEKANSRLDTAATDPVEVAKVNEAYAKALATATTATVALADVLEARTKAVTADAATLDADSWEQAEKELLSLAGSLESRGSISESKKDRALDRYNKAELTAITNKVLMRARGAESLARVGNAQRYAPQTFGNAEDLLSQAKASLQNDRYSTDAAVKLADAAETEFKHAIQIALEVERIRGRKISDEQLTLAWEERLQLVNRAAGNDYDSLESWDDIAGNLVTDIESGQTTQQNLQEELLASRRYIAGLEDELRAMDDKLGGAVAERDRLIVEQQAELRKQERIRQISNTFSPDEATVLRKDGEIVLRLQGMNFATGSSALSNDALDLLARSGAVIDNFPEASIRIEGHTDATGAAALNDRLSQERADSVMRYMVSELRVPAQRLTSEGLGSSQPVGLNTTADGRAKNRRIDIIILSDDTRGY